MSCLTISSAKYVSDNIVFLTNLTKVREGGRFRPIAPNQENIAPIWVHFHFLANFSPLVEKYDI